MNNGVYYLGGLGSAGLSDLIPCKLSKFSVTITHVMSSALFNKDRVPFVRYTHSSYNRHRDTITGTNLHKTAFKQFQIQTTEDRRHKKHEVQN